MRYFVTGASGWIGSAVVAELIEAGHEVVGLARSDASAGGERALGAGVHRGELDDLDSLVAGASASDGVVHLGYNHDFSRMGEAAQTDLAAITAIGAALEGTDRPLLIASGTLGLATGRVATEEDDADPGSTRGSPARRRRWTLPGAGCGRSWRASRRPCTDQATRASSRCWWRRRARPASPATSGTARTAGPRSTRSTPHGSCGWPSKPPRPARSCTRRRRKASRRCRSRRRSGRRSASRPRPSHPSTSTGSGRSSPRTSRPPAPARARCSAGSRRSTAARGHPFVLVSRVRSSRAPTGRLAAPGGRRRSRPYTRYALESPADPATTIGPALATPTSDSQH